MREAEALSLEPLLSEVLGGLVAALLVLLDMLLPLQPNPLGAPQERTERLAPKAPAHCKAHRRSMAIVRRPELPLVGGAVMVLLRRLLLLLLPRLVVLPRDRKAEADVVARDGSPAMLWQRAAKSRRTLRRAK